jgi:hypothetical protein
LAWLNGSLATWALWVAGPVIAGGAGYLTGSLINEQLSEDTQTAIGGTINEIVNEGGWSELFTHPFGLGL